MGSYERIDTLKIAINTIIDYFNYGNRLQNYALQLVLQKLGNDVVTIKNVTDIQQKKPSLSIRVHDLCKKQGIVKGSVHFFENRINRWKYKQIDQDRRNNFIEFSNKYIAESDFSVDEQTTDFDFDKYIDAYVVGSDQVWNYNFSRFSDLDFIGYSSKPKISYAASFGVNQIPDNLREMFRKGLDSFDYLSVRESVGKNIVKTLCPNKNVEQVLDPTLLIGMKEWMSLLTGSRTYTHKYLVVYFLDLPDTSTMDYIENYALSEHLEIKILGSRIDPDLWIADPVEFVNIFSQADAVFTDSFHACVFSIIFNKYFEVFNRNNSGLSMNSRIDTLLDILELPDRWHGKNSRHTIDYAKVMDKLEIQKKNSLEYLSTTLGKVEIGLKNNG